MTATVVGIVSDLRRYPVKSMLGEQLHTAAITDTGVAGDRTYALVDDSTGKVISVKRPKLWGRMFELRASTDSNAVRISFPDGATFAIDDPELTNRLSNFFGRSVSVATAPPPDAAYEEAWVGELKQDARPYLDTPTELVDGEEFIDGGAFMRVNKNFFDFAPLHVVTTASTRELAEHAPKSSFEPRRFRPNIVVDTGEHRFVESAWQGQRMSIGGVELKVGIPVPRCVMTTLAQDGLPADRNVLRTISKYSALDFLGTGTRYPCLGIYAEVSNGGGKIALGDEVTIG